MKSHKLIGLLFRSGKSVTSYPLRVIYQFTPSPMPLQAGFSASSRTFKRAVDRNRLKRLMREAYRLQKNALEQQVAEKTEKMILFFIYTGKELETFEVVSAKMKSLLSSLSKIVATEYQDK